MRCYGIVHVIAWFAAASGAAAGEWGDFRARHDELVASCVNSGQARKPKWVEREVAAACGCIVHQMELQVGYSMKKLQRNTAGVEYANELLAGDFIEAAVALDKKFGDSNNVGLPLRLEICKSPLME